MFIKIPWFLALIGFFGQSAIRMLRESWEGILPVQKDPNTGEQIVRPQGADLLAQELFSMLNDQTPQTNNAPVTINQISGAHGLTITSSGNTADPPVLNITGGNLNMAGTGSITIGTPSSGTTSGANVILTGANLYIPPIGQLSLPATDWNPLQPTQLPTLNLATLGNPTPGQAYIGQVTASLGGGNYTVSLAGVSGTVTASAVSLAGGYTVPTSGGGSVVNVIAVDNGSGGVTYNFQPYPFASQAISGAFQDQTSSGALSHLLSGLVNLGIITSTASSTPETITGDVTSALSTGALSNLLAGLAVLGVITNSTTNTPPTVTGSRNDGGPTIPALTNLLKALSTATGLGLIVDSTTA